MSDFAVVVESGENDELLQQACVLIQSSLRGHLARVQFKQRKSRPPDGQKGEDSQSRQRGRPKGSKNKKTMDKEEQDWETLEPMKKKRGRPPKPPVYTCKRPRGRPYGSKVKQKHEPLEVAPNLASVNVEGGTDLATTQKLRYLETEN